MAEENKPRIKWYFSGEPITEDTECWLCRRKAKELLDAVLDYLESGEEPFKEEGYAVCMETITFKHFFPFCIHVCIICADLIREIVKEYLTSELGIECIGDLFTVKDLEKIRLTFNTHEPEGAKVDEAGDCKTTG